MEILSERITQYMLQKKFITLDQTTWCHYMVVHRVMNIVSLVLLVPVGAIFVGWWGSLVFTLGLRFLRSRTGGYHAKTSSGCILASIAVQGAVLSLAPVFFNMYLLSIVTLLSIVVVLLLAPANNAHLHLSMEEIVALRPRIWARLAIMCGILLGLVWWNALLGTCAALSIFAGAFLLALSQLGCGAQ